MSENQALRDLDILANFEIALRNLAGPYASAQEVVGRLAGRRRYEAAARPLRYQMTSCPPATMIAAVSALRAALEEE
jgi:hypothetical protein